LADPQQRHGYLVTARHSHQATTTKTTQGSRDRNTRSTNSTTAAETAVRRTIAFDWLVMKRQRGSRGITVQAAMGRSVENIGGQPPIHTLQAAMGNPVMRWLPLTVWLLPLGSSAWAQPHNPHCPGQNTMEMRICAGCALERTRAKLQPKLPAALLVEWQQTARAVCAQAYAPYSGGSVYPQVVVGCENQLSLALLRHFQPLNNQEQAPSARPNAAQTP
jgi:hypothetical protein